MIQLFQNIRQSMELAKPLIWSPEADKDLENILELEVKLRIINS